MEYEAFKTVMLKWLDNFNIEDYRAIINNEEYLQDLYNLLYPQKDITDRRDG